MMKGQILAKMDTDLKERQEFDFYRLYRLLNKTQAFIQDQRFTQFRRDLEVRFPQFENRLQSYSNQLQSSQCVLLITGEIGSGKSSLINLLLESELLPTSELECTSTYVEITYGKVPKFTAHYRDNGSGECPKPYKASLDSHENIDSLLRKVKDVTTSRNQETDESMFETVQLEGPVKWLEQGVTIVDCPGVGGNERISPQLCRYLERSFGCVYVINSSSNMSKHWLGQLLLRGIEFNDGFENQATLFVCSHLDKVPLADAEKALDSTRTMLSGILPEEAYIQLYPLSVTESAQAVTRGELTSQHKDLLSRLHKFVPQSRKAKLRTCYRYLSSLLNRALFAIRVSCNVNKEKMKKVESRFIQVHTRLAMKQGNPEERLDKITHQVRDKLLDASCDLLEYLNKTSTRITLTKWEDKDCPQKQNIFRKKKILKQASAQISERVGARINMWEKENSFVNSIETAIVQLCKNEFQLIDEELKELQDAGHRKMERKSPTSEANSISGRNSHTSEANSTRGRRSHTSDTDNRSNNQSNAQEQNNHRQDSLPSIGNAVTSSCNIATLEHRLKPLFSRQYSKNPSKTMEEATELYLDAMMNSNIAVTAAIRTYFDRLLNSIVQVGARVHDLMEVERKLLVQLKEELEVGKAKLKLLPELKRISKRIIGDLDLLYVQDLIVPDFRKDQVKYSDSDLVGVGTFAYVYKGVLRLKNGEAQVAVKVLKDTLGPQEVSDALLEERMLRNLKHVNIVKYYGMITKRKDNNKLILVMEYCPFTLKKKCLKAKKSPSHLGDDEQRQREAIQRMTKYVRQICSALTYLHHKFIVHGDLKPENIMLSDQDDVRIADLGLAKKVKDLEHSQIGTPVYMAPEMLLLKGKFDTKVDIYSFALIMWELWYGKDLATFASEEIQCEFTKVIEDQWRPTLSRRHAPDTFWSQLIQECWQQEPTKRPTAPEVAHKLLQYEV